MKKATKGTTPAAHDGKGFLALAGEALSVLGEEIVEGKDKVLAAATEKFTTVKKAISKKLAKKKSPAGKKKGAVSKRTVKKVARKAVAKARAKVKKATKKPSPTKKKK